MKKLSVIAIAILAVIDLHGQTFEGKITYQNTIKSNLPNVTDEQFTSMMGDKQEYYIRGGDYRSVTNGTLMLWQLYINKDNKLYNKITTSETIFWIDGSINEDSVISMELNKGVTEILGYKCDQLILICKSGSQEYYFSSKIAVDANLFKNHKYGNWYDFLKHSNSLPLKMIIESQQFRMESVAIEVVPMKVESSLFDLPVNAKTEKSQY